MPSSPPRLASGCKSLKFPKGPTRAELKGSDDRYERQAIKRNRAACDRRDGFCRIGYWRLGVVYFGECYGRSEWHHFDKRSRTRNLPPDDRHSTAVSAKCCAKHHQMFEAHEIKHEFLTKDGADGVMAFWIDDSRRLVEHEMPKPRYR